MTITRVALGEYHQRFGPLRDRIFGSKELPEDPFAIATWTRILLPGGFYLDSDLMPALRQAAAAVGDAECVVVDRHGSFPEELPLRMALDEEDWDNARTGTLFGHIEVEMFPPVGAWGLVVSPEGFSLLAGSETFMEVFLAGVPGGLNEIRSRVTTAIASGEIGFGEEGKGFAERLLRIVGWA